MGSYIVREITPPPGHYGTEETRSLEVVLNQDNTLSVVYAELNDDAYIVPGLGDAGDRQFGPR